MHVDATVFLNNLRAKKNLFTTRKASRDDT